VGSIRKNNGGVEMQPAKVRYYLLWILIILAFQMLVGCCYLVVLEFGISARYMFVLNTWGGILVVMLSTTVIFLYTLIFRYARCPCCGKFLLTNYKCIRKFMKGKQIECSSCKSMIVWDDVNGETWVSWQRVRVSIKAECAGI